MKEPMYEYTPFYSPQIMVEYQIVGQGQVETFEQPGYDPEIEIVDIKINDQEIDEYLVMLLLKTHEKQWEKEIIDQIKLGKAVA